MTESANALWLTAAEAAARGDRLGLPKDATRAALLTAVRIGEIRVRAERDGKERLLGPGQTEDLDLDFGDVGESIELNGTDAAPAELNTTPPEGGDWLANSPAFVCVVREWLGHLSLRATEVDTLLATLRHQEDAAPPRRPGRKAATYWEPYLRELARFVISSGFPDQFPPLRDHLRATVDPTLEVAAPDDNQLRRWAKVEIDRLRAPL